MDVSFHHNRAKDMFESYWECARRFFLGQLLLGLNQRVRFYAVFYRWVLAVILWPF